MRHTISRRHFDRQETRLKTDIASRREKILYLTTAFTWLLGGNDLGEPQFDHVTGGCCDGVRPDQIKQNQGAESTLALLLSLLEMIPIQDAVAEPGMKHEVVEE